eukprot:Blabericola_migrator_1__13287@NODE_92_length_14506_cov_884_657940_g82_i0_p2_GENE_NODE_92_length_14506_cov_884_657940_g82_i0NODE_92_length_14506_cov_884_657940_g82_i0_p2_ORF_typecomplete_len758_score82_08HEAT_2/PF13646_6/60HEAT_2/PF13646_6/8_8e02HEAT_2/PF13646_6/2_3e02HEAT_2/PF13646_6/4_7HEAT_2/PF13646_6/8_3e02HEAT_2/PF13646_6/24HEAT/PF02985_22/12HEAT/PF02985_22/1_3e03HEAT/PF02985_22/1_1e02HEAT/PF02985_22/92HEAT/PF02985_22/1e04HEAT/PF02985_22/19Adaptin_N/PF01602_20/5_6e02Adaptin_N/PF01602_20/3_1e
MLLSSGCIDLFLGMATSENPYKRASVAYVLPALLKLLSEYKAGDEGAVQPLKSEIVKLFFDMASANSTVSRRAFALNFGPMAMILMTHPFSYVALSMPKALNALRNSAMIKEIETVGPTPLEIDLCLVPYIFLEDPNPEMRLLAVPVAVTVSLMLFLKYARPFNLESGYPTLACLFAWLSEQESEGQTVTRRVDSTPPLRCSQCQFSWTVSSCVAGIFSLSTSPSFELIRTALMLTELNTATLLKHQPLQNAKAYATIANQVLLPVFEKALSDEWITRIVVVDCLPFLLDLILSQLSPQQVERFVTSRWLAILADDDHTEVRAVALQKFTLHAWLFSRSVARGCLEPRSQSKAATSPSAFNPTDRVATIAWPPEFNKLDGLTAFVDRCSHIVQSATSDADIRLRLAAAELAPQFLLLLKHPQTVADYFITPLLSLLRDLDHHVIVSALGALRCLTWSSLVQLGEKEQTQELQLVQSLQPRLPIGIRSPLMRSHNVDIEKFVPFSQSTTLNTLSVTRTYISLLERSLIPAITSCLSASATSQISAEAPPSVIPLWRIRCAILHLLPMLDDVLEFTDVVKLNDSNKPFYSELLVAIRSTLTENTAVVRRCAATVSVKLCAKARTPSFSALLLQPLFNQCMLRQQQPNIAGVKGFKICLTLLSAALIEHVDEEGIRGSREIFLQDLRWTPDVFSTFVDCLIAISNDKVQSTREAVATSLEVLATKGALDQAQLKVGHLPVTRLGMTVQAFESLRANRVLH